MPESVLNRDHGHWLEEAASEELTDTEELPDIHALTLRLKSAAHGDRARFVVGNEIRHENLIIVRWKLARFDVSVTSSSRLLPNRRKPKASTSSNYEAADESAH